ncbi:MAG: histidine kinase N-terminal 7TM domain-containing protein [Patescibacteria group bacterium]|jgi:hypothetical protein
MQIHGYILLGVIILEALLGRYVYYRDRKNPVNIAFSLLVLCILIWVAINAKLALTIVADDIAWYRSAYFTGLLIGASQLYFVWVFPYRTFVISRKKAAILLLPVVVFIHFIFFTRFIISGIQNVGVTARGEFGNGFYVYLIIFACYFIVGFYSLLKKYIHSDGIHRWQLKYIFISILIPFLINILLDMVLPALHVTRMPWMEYFGAESSVIWLGFTSYVLFKK